jgi:tetratricopeptide (TPR) repeat protein
MALLVVILPLLACGDDDSGPTIPEVVTLLDQGWELFAVEDYPGALSKFEAAVAADRGLGDGHNGLGWTYLRMDSLDVALESFNLAAAKGLVGAGAQAGRCLILNRRNEYRQAIFAGQAAIDIDPLFELEADPTLDIRDVRLAMAQSHLSLAEYVEAMDQVATIDPSIVLNQYSATFVAELIAEMEALEGRLELQ